MSKLCKYIEDVARGMYSTTGIHNKYKKFYVDFQYLRYSKMILYQVWLQKDQHSDCLCVFWIRDGMFYE